MTTDQTLVNVPFLSTYYLMASQQVNGGCCRKFHYLLEASANQISFSVRIKHRSNFFWLHLRYRFQNIYTFLGRKNSSYSVGYSFGFARSPSSRGPS